MKKKAKLIGYIIGILVFVSTIAGFTYAMYRKSLYNVNISGELKNLNEYVIYSKGVNISSGTLNPSTSYTNGSSATITFYKSNSAPYDIYGHIYLDINSMAVGVSHELKYTIVDNNASNIISEGSFYTYSTGSSILAAANIPLNNTETTYTVYVWLDEELYDSSIANSSFDIDIRCYATMKTIANYYVNVPVPSTNNAANYIKYMYDSHSKSTATVNSITYNLAPSVNLMNDRHASMSTDINGGDIRFYGANPNNYVWLGDTFTTNYRYSSNGSYLTKAAGSKKLWRIIGVFDGRLKLIAADPISTQRLSWDTSASSVNSGYGINQWGESTYSSNGNPYEGADLMRLLNPGFETDTVNNSLYWTKGTGTVYTGGSNKTTVDVSFANTGLSSTEKNMIDTATWYLGASVSSSYVDVQYAAERQNSVLSKSGCSNNASCNDTVTRTATWEGKVGLIYSSDYGYATDLSLCTSTLVSYRAIACRGNDWLFNTSFEEYMISPGIYASNSFYIFATNIDEIVAQNGYVTSSSAGDGRVVRSSIYLKPNITITSGKGTEADPYVLSLS